MKLLGLTFGATPEQPIAPIQQSVQEEQKNQTDATGVFQFDRPELPMIIDSRQYAWVIYGDGPISNNYPLLLKKFRETSAMHGAILQGKAQMMAGAGFLVNDAEDAKESNKNYLALDPATKAAYDNFLLNPKGSECIDDIVCKLTHDYQTYGAMAMELVWSLDFSRIALVKFVPVETVRSGKLGQDGLVHDYFLCRNWTKFRTPEFEPRRIAAFDEENRNEYSQLLYIRNPNSTNEYYGTPSYVSALSWIGIETAMGEFHLSNISNGFNPSMLFKFYKRSAPEEQQYIIQNLKRQFSGSHNAGKGMFLFSDGKDLAPDFEKLQMDNLDKQFLLLADQAVQQILSGHRVTSPLLFGISVPGNLGGNSELKTAFDIFDSTVIEPDRNILGRMINRILKVNNIAVSIEVEKFVPMSLEDDLESKRTNVVQQYLSDPTMTPDMKYNVLVCLFSMDTAIAQQIVYGGPPPGAVEPKPIAAPGAPAPTAPLAAVNDNIKNLTGRQHQSMIRIIRQYSKGQITREQASTLLRTGLGMLEDDINNMLGPDNAALEETQNTI